MPGKRPLGKPIGRRRYAGEIEQLRARVREINVAARNRGMLTAKEEAEIRRINESIRRLKQEQ